MIIIITRIVQEMKHFNESHIGDSVGRVWIYRLVFDACVCVCTVTNFFAQHKASGVEFCTVVHRRPGQGISHFWELNFAPQKPKIGRIGA